MSSYETSLSVCHKVFELEIVSENFDFQIHNTENNAIELMIKKFQKKTEATSTTKNCSKIVATTIKDDWQDILLDRLAWDSRFNCYKRFVDFYFDSSKSDEGIDFEVLFKPPRFVLDESFGL